MENPTVPEPAARLRSNRHDIGLAISVLLTFVFAVSIAWLAQFFLAERPDAFSLATLVLMALPLLLSFVAIAISLARRPLWLRVGVALFLLLVPPALVFSGAFHG